MDRSPAFYEVVDALRESGCPICRLRDRESERFLDYVLWERVGDPELLKHLRRARGFCGEHAWALLRPGASVNICVLMREVLADLLAPPDVSARPSRSNRRGLVSRWPGSRHVEIQDLVAAVLSHLDAQDGVECPACTHCQKMERIYLQAFVDNLGGREGTADLYEASDGLCLPHLRTAVALVPDKDTLDVLSNAQRVVWRRIIEDLAEAVRKNDYRFQDESWGDEAEAWLRAIQALAGPAPDRGPQRVSRWRSRMQSGEEKKGRPDANMGEGSSDGDDTTERPGDFRGANQAAVD